MKLETAHAIYQNRRLSFRETAPSIRDGTDVIVIFPVDESGLRMHKAGDMDVLKALRGRARGEGLNEKLLKLRRR